MKRFRNATLAVQPGAYQIPSYDFDTPSLDISLGGGESGIPEPIPLSLPVKDIVYIDPVISQPINTEIADIVLTKPILQPVVYKEPETSAEPIKQVTFIDPVVSQPKILNDEQINVISQNYSSPEKINIVPEPTSGNDIMKFVDDVVENINVGVNELLSTEVKESPSVIKDQTGLYLAGAVVALGLLTLIFKK